MVVFGSMRLDFYLFDYTNCPYMSGSGLSSLGTFSIEKASMDSFSMRYESCECHLQHQLQSSDSVSIFDVTMTCINDDGTLNAYVDKTGVMIIKSGAVANKAKMADQVQPTWLQAQFTERSELDGQQQITRATSKDFVLFPKVSGTGSDENGDFVFVAFTTTSIKSRNCFWKVYNSGTVIQYDVEFTTRKLGEFVATGQYETSSGRRGSVEISATYGVMSSDIGDMVEPLTLILNYGGGTIDHLYVTLLPDLTGTGVDTYSRSGMGIDVTSRRK